MRVLTVSHFFESHGGGIERVAGHLCRQFARTGAKAVWAASDFESAPDGEVEAVPLACTNPIEKIMGLPMPLPGLGAVGALAREVRRSDAVVVHDALYVTSMLAMLMAKIWGKRVVLIQHIAAIPFSSRVLRLALALANVVVTRPMMWAADALVFISDTVRHDLVGTPARRPYKLLFNGVDRAIFYPTDGPISVPGCIARIADKVDSQRILFVGRYVEKKGLTIVRALAELRPDITFLLVGSGPIKPTEWELTNVHDLGVQSPQVLADLYRMADILLLPSVGEGYPLVIQEAMACGLPVVCGEPANRADPDAAAWLRGVAIELANPEASAQRCAEAIDSLAIAPAERSAMARYASTRYDWQAMAQDVLALARPPASA